MTTVSNQFVSHRQCPVCNGDQSSAIWTYDSLQYYDDGPGKSVDYSVKRCRDCDALFMNPTFTPDGFSRLFELAGMSYGSSEGRHQEQVDWLNAKVDLASTGTVMDVGCYQGDFLRAFPSSVARVGLDFDQAAIEIAGTLDPEGIYVQGDFEIGSWTVPTPDLITMFHVIEHVRNPQKVLANLARASHRSTLLCIETPVIENTVLDDVHGFFSPQHLTHFSRKSLHRLLSDSDWEILVWEEISGYNGTRVLLGLEGGEKQSANIQVPQSELSEHHVHLSYLSDWLEKVAAIEEKIARLKCERLVIWGAGMHSEILFHLTSIGHLVSEATLVDADPKKIGKFWRGREILSPQVIPTIRDIDCLIISSYGNQDEIAREARALGVKDESIIRLYDELHVY